MDRDFNLSSQFLSLTDHYKIALCTTLVLNIGGLVTEIIFRRARQVRYFSIDGTIKTKKSRQKISVQRVDFSFPLRYSSQRP